MNQAASQHVHDDHADAHDENPVHFSLKDYATGFLLSVLLTAIPFWLVMTRAIPDSTVASLVVLAFAAVQIVVHMMFFLHLNSKSEGGWNLLSVLFTLIILVVVLAGSLWVMYHMNNNMMPMSPHEARNLP